MRDRPHWDGRPTRLSDGGWGVLIQRIPGAPTPRPGDTVKVRTRRRRNWTARIVAIEEARRQTVVRATGPAEATEVEGLSDAAAPELASSVEDDPLATLREAADTLHAATAALRAAQLGGEQEYREVLSAIYYAEDDQGCNLVEAHQVLRFLLPVRNASEHALEGAGRLLEAATDTLFGARDLLEQVAWLDDFGEVKAASTLRAAIARMDAAGLLEAAGDAIREAALLLADPANPNSADLNQEHREEFLTLRKICNALRRVLPNARQDES